MDAVARSVDHCTGNERRRLSLMNDKGQVIERLKSAERELRDLAQDPGIKGIGGTRNIWTSPETLERVADICKEAQDQLNSYEPLLNWYSGLWTVKRPEQDDFF
jgi:hypothetical protein